MKKSSTIITARVHPSVRKYLKKLADGRGMKFSFFIEKILTDYTPRTANEALAAQSGTPDGQAKGE